MHRYPAYDSGGIALAGCLFLGTGIGLLIAVLKGVSWQMGALLTGAGFLLGLGVGMVLMGVMVFHSTRQK